MGWALSLVGRERTSTRQFVSREELKLLLQMEPEEADVPVSEAEMIDKIFDLGETAVREVMVPLVDVAALPETASRADAVQLIQERGFSRIPVFTDKVFNIVGVVTAMDVRRGGGRPTCASLMRPGEIGPETKHIDDLLREMQENRVAARGGGRRVRRRGRHRHRRGHSRGGGRRDPRRRTGASHHRELHPVTLPSPAAGDLDVLGLCRNVARRAHS